jgi:hypothetical protein
VIAPQPARRFRGRPPEPYRVRTLRSRRDWRYWLSLATSSTFHVFLILLATGLLARKARKEEGPMPARLFDPSRQVQMVFVPPPPRAKTPALQPPLTAFQPSPSREAAPAGRYSPTPDPEPNATAEEKPSKASAPPTSEPETPDAAPPKGSATEAPVPLATNAPAPAAESSQESEAQRIFGRPRARPGEQSGTESVRPFETANPNRAGGCPSFTPPTTDPSAAPTLGSVAGRIFRLDNGKPLAGAHLQIIGTQFATFTNDQGEYVLTFEVRLLENCRTQYVRVSADGFESRIMVLLAGRNLPSEDVLLRRQ